MDRETATTVAGEAATVSTRILFVLSAVLLARGAAAAEREPVVLELVEQLGDSSFAAREEAARSLLALGTECIPALRNAAESNDLEVRYRARRLVDEIEAQDHQRRLEAFAADAGGEAEELLPAWAHFRTSVGGDAAAREFFVGIQRAESKLFRTWEKGSDDLAKAYDRRVVELHYMYAQRNDRRDIARHVGALLYLGADAGLDVSTATGYTLYSFLNYNEFRQSVGDDETGRVLRKVLGNWIAQPTGTSPHLKVNLALQQGLKEGLSAAERMLRDGAPPAQLQYAVLAVGRFGGPEHVPLLEPLLDDTTVLTASRSNSKVTYTCEARDVALAVLLHLTGAAPKSYGFSRLTKNPQFLYSPTSMGFNSDEQRAAALRRWRTMGPGAPVEAPLPSEPPVEAPAPRRI